MKDNVVKSEKCVKVLTAKQNYIKSSIVCISLSECEKQFPKTCRIPLLYPASDVTLKGEGCHGKNFHFFSNGLKETERETGNEGEREEHYFSRSTHREPIRLGGGLLTL